MPLHRTGSASKDSWAEFCPCTSLETSSPDPELDFTLCLSRVSVCRHLNGPHHTQCGDSTFSDPWVGIFRCSPLQPPSPGPCPRLFPCNPLEIPSPESITGVLVLQSPAEWLHPCRPVDLILRPVVGDPLLCAWRSVPRPPARALQLPLLRPFSPANCSVSARPHFVHLSAKCFCHIKIKYLF